MGSYDRYLTKLQQRLDDRSILDEAQKKIRYLKTDYDQYGDNLQQELRRSGMPAGTMAAISENQQQDWLNKSGQIYSQAESQDRARREQIGDKIEEVEFQQDEARRKRKKEEKQESGFRWRAIAQGVGAAAGFIAGGPAGAAAGANLLGGAADMAIGLDKSYDSPELIFEGIGNTLSGVMQTSGLIEDKNFAGYMNEAKDILKDDHLTSEARGRIIDDMQSDQQSMSFKDFKEKWDHLLPSQSQPGSI